MTLRKTVLASVVAAAIAVVAFGGETLVRADKVASIVAHRPASAAASDPAAAASL